MNIFHFFAYISAFSVIPSYSETLKSTENPLLSPCHDFYDYVCSKDTRIIKKNISARNYEGMEITKPNDPNLVPTNETVPLDKIVELTKVMKWYSEIECLYTSRLRPDFFGDLYTEKKKTHPERYEAVKLRLSELNSTCINVFYKALSASVDILSIVKPPVSRRNEFLHWLFNTIKNSTLEEVRKANISEDDKSQLLEQMSKMHSYFAFYDFNNITVIKQAKLVYEKEYYRLKMLLSENDLEQPEAEKILRLGAIDASMNVLREYIDRYEDRFIFQAVVANPTNDAFQYLGNNHITIITRNDPNQPEKALADTVFVTTHEIFHYLYPFGKERIGDEIYESAMNCTSVSMEKLGDSDAVKPLSANWYDRKVAHEDVVNVIAMRVVMKLASERSVNDKQLRNDIETVVGGLCRQGVRKNEPISLHNPLETSLNNAVRQYPLFKKLYQCKPGDRMFAKDEEFCEPTGLKNFVEDYEIKINKTSKDEGGFFGSLLSISKQMNFSYGVL